VSPHAQASVITPDLTARYRHRSVVPDLPALSQYLPLLEEMAASGWYSNFGPLVRRLESGLQGTLGTAAETCVTCCNATAGLSAALLTTGRTDQVLLPAFTFAASLGAVRAAGMTPVVIDVDPQNWILGGDSLDRALKETGARLVMLVTPFGIQRNWERELAICRARGAAVVIDNASGLGCPRLAHCFTEEVFEVFSMHTTKPFAVGEGGAIFTHSSHDANLRSVLNFGLDSHSRLTGPCWGFNGKMSELHAAIGIAQLNRFRDIVSHRQAFAAVYRDRIAQYPEVVCPQDMHASPWQFFPTLLPSMVIAERFIEAAAAVGVEIRRYYRPSLSRWRSTRCFGACPVAEDLSNRMCVLPVRGCESPSEIAQIADLVLDALDKALTGR
jgi:dTDP-4-amino-4,6-dideoxygalactose transaminase